MFFLLKQLLQREEEKAGKTQEGNWKFFSLLEEELQQAHGSKMN